MIEKCTDCRLWKTSHVGNGLYSCNKLMGVGDEAATIMFVDTYPRDEEVKQKHPYAGIEGQLLKRGLKSVGIENAFFTYLCKCKPEFKQVPTAVEIKECGKYLREEIERIKPAVIVTLGSIATKFFKVTGAISQVRGIPILSEELNCYILPTYSPTYINNFVDAAKQKREFIQDLGKALTISRGEQKDPVTVNYECASTVAEVKKFTSNLLNSDWFSADTETDGLDYLRSRVLMSSFSAQEGTGIVIPHCYLDRKDNPPVGQMQGRIDEQWSKEVFPYLRQIYASPIKKIFQNGKFDIQMLKTALTPVSKYAFDTMLAHYLLDENSPHGLGKIVPIYTDMGNYKDDIKDYISGKIKILVEGVEAREVGKLTRYFDSAGNKIKKVEAFRKSTIFDCPYGMLTTYSAQDADATFRLFKALRPLLEKENLLKLLVKIMVPLSYVLAQMEYTGIGGDREYTSREVAKLVAEQGRLSTLIQTSKEVVAYKEKYQVLEFKPNSPKQKKELLFDIMDLTPTKYNKVTAKQRAEGKKKGEPSTDKEALGLLLEKNKSKVIENFLGLAKIKKSKDYLSSYDELLSESADGRIHTSFLQHSTVTGRLSSRAPNLQNIPSQDKEKAKLIRTALRAKPGYMFIEADYSQVEFRIWAHCSGDEALIKYINEPGPDGEPGDIHTKIAAMIYKITEENVSKLQRTMAKAVVYGMMYGMSAWTLAITWNMDEDEVNRFTNGFFRAFPVAARFLEDNILLMEKQGYVTNLFGRRRRALGIYSKDKLEKEGAQRQARNSPLQSGAADVINVAMIKLYRNLLPYGETAQMELQIHDSLIMEVKETILDEIVGVITETMTKAVPLKCRLDIDVEVGYCLGEMFDWEPGKVYNKV